MAENKGWLHSQLKPGIITLVLWCLTTLGLLALFSLLLWQLELPSRFMAYASASVSFASAAVLAWRAARQYKNRILTALVLAAFLVLFLLITGYLLSGGAYTKDAILSISSFTLAGALAGSLLAPQQHRTAKTAHRSKFKAQRRKLT